MYCRQYRTICSRRTINRAHSLTCMQTSSCTGYNPVCLCSQFLECIYPKTCSIELTDRSTIAIFRHFGEHRHRNTANEDFLTRKRRSSPKIQSTQHVRTTPFSQVMLKAKLKRERLIHVTLRHHTRKRIECNAARHVPGVKCNVNFFIIVAIFTEKKKSIFKKQIAAMDKERSMIMLATKETTEDMLAAPKLQI